MKIYNEITLEWNEDTKRYDNVVSEDSYEYDGELELAQQADKGLARFLTGTGIMRHNIKLEDALDALKKTGEETKNWWDSASGWIDTIGNVATIASMLVPGVREATLLTKAIVGTGVKGITKFLGSATADVLAPDVDVPGKIKQLQTGTKDRPAVGVKDWEKIAEGYGDIGQQSRGAGLRMRQGALMNLPGDFVKNLMQAYVMGKLTPPKSMPTRPNVPVNEGEWWAPDILEDMPDAGASSATGLGTLEEFAPWKATPSIDTLKAAMPGSNIPAFQLNAPPDLGMTSAPSLGFPQSIPLQEQMMFGQQYQLPRDYFRDPVPPWLVPLGLSPTAG